MRQFASGIRVLPLLAAALTLVLPLSVPAPALAQGVNVPNAPNAPNAPNNPRRGGTFESFFSPYAPPSPPRPVQPERSSDYTHAPSPRREAPTPTPVLVLGDSMADWLAYGLEDALSDAPEMGVIRRNRAGSGLIRYDTRNENQDWTTVAREAIAATKPKFIVMMIGLNDRQSIRVRTVPAGAARSAPADAQGTPPNSTDPAETPTPDIVTAEPAPQARNAMQTLEFRSDAWAEQYTKRIDAMIAVLKSANVPVLWVGLPSIRGPKSTGDMQYLDELFRPRAEKAGISFIDVWDGFVDESGRYTVHGPDFEGQTRRLRVNDGVHFTKAGARKLAHYVEREIRRTVNRGVTPVALPATEPQVQTPVARPGQPTARPLSGPVLPLTASAAAQQDLVGAELPSPPPEQPVVKRVLQNGEAISSPAGRSDDFQWPRRDIAPFGTDPVVATTTDPLPVMRAAPAKTVAAPNEEPRTVAATPSGRRTSSRASSQQHQQQRRTNPSGGTANSASGNANSNGFFQFLR